MNTGATQLAYAWIDKWLPGKPQRVIDLGAGWGALSAKLYDRGHTATAVDINTERLFGRPARYERFEMNMRQIPWPIGDRQWDVAISQWSMMHLLGDEASAWRELRRHVVPDGMWITIHRYEPVCRRWMSRIDPMNCYTVEAFKAVAFATGWTVRDWSLGWYDNDDWRFGGYGEPNTLCAVLRPDPEA